MKVVHVPIDFYIATDLSAVIIHSTYVIGEDCSVCISVITIEKKYVIAFDSYITNTIVHIVGYWR